MKARAMITLAAALLLIQGSVFSGQGGGQDRRPASTAAQPASGLKCAFSYTPRYPAPGQAVQFMDASSGSPTTWRWDFGDGAVSTLQNPTHAFAAPGFYTVSLEAGAGAAAKSARRTVTVFESNPLAASFAFQPSIASAGGLVQFTDTSTGGPTSWLWDFGDGATSTVQNPGHVFGRKGFYRLTLTAARGTVSRKARRTIAVFGEAPLAADFTYGPSAPAAGEPVQFTDASAGVPTSWAWDFGDGATSTARNPLHTFATAGSKTVTLTASSASKSSTATKTVTVAVALAASFSFSPSSPAAGQSVQFTDASTGGPTSWSWSFGDGATSTLRNPAHAFATAGSKTVTLTASNAARSSTTTRTVAVAAALAASFSFSPSSPAVGQSIQFTDATTGGPTSWSWSFGDGATSTLRNPAHAFATAGSKTVTLTASNASGSGTATRTVTVAAVLAASFGFNPASPAAGQSVRFTDTSTGGPTAWSWNFNDGGSSTAQNPSHVFLSPGSYNVTMVVSRAGATSSASRSVTVTPSTTLTAAFTFSPASPAVGQTVQFTDASTGGPTSWQWAFGDGSTSTSRNPGHAFAAAGAKTVTLTVANASTSDSESRTVTVLTQAPIVIDHTCRTLADIPPAWIEQAKQKLHIAYGHTSHGSQLTTGMTGLVAWKGDLYAFNAGGPNGALDLRDYSGNFGGLGIADDLGAPDRTAWERATRLYLAANPSVNVILWSWCGQVDGTEAEIQLYLDLMSDLETDFPGVKFVYMTGHTDGTPLTANVPRRNQQIRDYCAAHNKILYDFADIESWDPDGVWYGDKLVNDRNSYDSDGDGVLDRNWAVDWQNAHPGQWYDCVSAHSQPLNANLKAYAAWWLWARLAGWAGR